MEGMEEIVASVSGYHGSERNKLIKLITSTGASYVGALTRSTTHLVCWKHEGEKYQLAKIFGAKIVNHQWIEDCIKKGKRIPEKSYSLLSGKQVGSIALDVPDISNQLGVSGKKKLVRNGRQKSCTDPVIDIEYEITEHHDWDDRLLFTKNEESSKGVSKSSRKLKKRVHDGTTTKDTISPDPPRSSRRLVKMNRYLAESLTDMVNRSLANESLSANDNVASTSNHFSLRNENEESTSGTDEGPRDAFTNQSHARNQNYSEVEASDVPETGDEDLILQKEETVTTTERPFHDARSDAENVNEKLKMAEQVEEPAKNTASSDPSCVICWTKFSSTRGVLPCRHRFCFSCIQNWADCMVTKGKTSTCPLCKASFTTITRVEEEDCANQKIYSQTVPCASTQDIFILPDGPPVFNPLQVAPSEPACCQCHRRELADCLLKCYECNVRCIHNFCLDPKVFPWVCSSCKNFRLLYNRY